MSLGAGVWAGNWWGSQGTFLYIYIDSSTPTRLLPVECKHSEIPTDPALKQLWRWFSGSAAALTFYRPPPPKLDAKRALVFGVNNFFPLHVYFNFISSSLCSSLMLFFLVYKPSLLVCRVCVWILFWSCFSVVEWWVRAFLIYLHYEFWTYMNGKESC